MRLLPGPVRTASTVRLQPFYALTRLAEFSVFLPDVYSVSECGVVNMADVEKGGLIGGGTQVRCSCVV